MRSRQSKLQKYIGIGTYTYFCNCEFIQLLQSTLPVKQNRLVDFHASSQIFSLT